MKTHAFQNSQQVGSISYPFRTSFVLVMHRRDVLLSELGEHIQYYEETKRSEASPELVISAVEECFLGYALEQHYRSGGKFSEDKLKEFKEMFRRVLGTQQDESVIRLTPGYGMHFVETWDCYKRLEDGTRVPVDKIFRYLFWVFGGTFHPEVAEKYNIDWSFVEFIFGLINEALFGELDYLLRIDHTLDGSFIDTDTLIDNIHLYIKGGAQSSEIYLDYRLYAADITSLIRKNKDSIARLWYWGTANELDRSNHLKALRNITRDKGDDAFIVFDAPYSERFTD